MRKLIIAIDGHSSCGKSTLAKDLAKCFSYRYIDTGAMYRAVTLYALEEGIIKSNKIDTGLLKTAFMNKEIDICFNYNNETGKSDTFLNKVNVEAKIRTLRVSDKVSNISVIDFVRENLVNQQRIMGSKGGVVLDGRDIGTAVFPNADLKIFLTAEVNIRAERRFKEIKDKEKNLTIEEVKKNIENRDFIDSNREKDPLKMAIDAILIDNSYITPKEQTDKAVELVMQTLTES